MQHATLLKTANTTTIITFLKKANTTTTTTAKQRQYGGRGKGQQRGWVRQLHRTSTQLPAPDNYMLVGGSVCAAVMIFGEKLVGLSVAVGGNVEAGEAEGMTIAVGVGVGAGVGVVSQVVAG
jgi:hypothetical protein